MQGGSEAGDRVLRAGACTLAEAAASLCEPQAEGLVKVGLVFDKIEKSAS